MYSNSIDQFYKRIRSKIAVIGGYLDDKLICSIIKSCRLKPSDVFTNASFQLRVPSLERTWFDEFDHKLIITEKKKLEIRCQPHLGKISTDLFRNETIEFIMKHSKYAFVGLTPESENFTLLFMGSDNYLRCYSHNNGVFELCSPLTVGIKVLRRVVNSRQIKQISKLTLKSEMPELASTQWFTVPAFELSRIDNIKKIRSILLNG